MALSSSDGVFMVKSKTALVAGALLAIAIGGADIVEGPEPRFIGILAALPLLYAAFGRYLDVLIIGGVSLVVGITVGMVSGDPANVAQLTQLIAIIVATIAGAVICKARERASARVASLRRLASVAQQAVLRPAPDHVGELAIAVRYVSASADADIGGDLYEALDTPYGVRLLIGDVRGKGLDAVRLASTVLGSYRHVAHERADLRAVVSDLDRAVARSVGYEDFVTACLVEERGGTLTVLNCGHPPPLLLRRGEVKVLEPDVTVPPLGFMPTAAPRVERLEPGDRVLLFTDGLTEARREGEFFPINQRAWRILGHGTVEDGLISLANALTDWVHGVLSDDIALMLFEYLGARSPAETELASPAWEWDTLTSDRPAR